MFPRHKVRTPRQLWGTAGFWGVAYGIAPFPATRFQAVFWRVVWRGGMLSTLAGSGKTIQRLAPNTDHESTPGGGDY
jgi:hypothetical protein